MPSKNIVKEFDSNAYYHVYNRGVEKRKIFNDEEDYSVFLNLIKRYTSRAPIRDDKGREYEWLSDRLEIVAFCLMPNHFHIFLYQNDPEAMTYLLRAVTGAYTVYFNKKYRRVGSLFQATYKAVRVKDEAYFQHITRYIHLNPSDYLGWEWSSCQMYLGYREFEWVHPEHVIDRGQTAYKKYALFLDDYVEYQSVLKEVNTKLANT